LRAKLGVSRTTVRKVISTLSARGIVTGSGGERVVRAQSESMERFPETETVSPAAHVEKRFLEWMLRENARPGTAIDELNLARQFGVATTGIREFLNRFQRFGLIEKRPNSRWVLKGFTPGFALELFEVREMFELRSARTFAALPSDSPLWRQMEAVRDEHLSLLGEIEYRFHDFFGSRQPIPPPYQLRCPHCHYQWNKRDERQRNEVAVREHLTYIEALLSRSISMAELACRAHLTSARETLIRSTSGSDPAPPNPGRQAQR
jgi:DNA-binding GntR family transcriptional regulator